MSDFATAQQMAEGVHELWMARLAEGWCPTPRHGRLAERDNQQGWCGDCHGWYRTQGNGYLFVMRTIWEHQQ